MKDGGWIKISRGLRGHWLSRDFRRLGWWVDLLLTASWQDEEVLSDGHLFTLRRGQMIMSVSDLRLRWDASTDTVRDFLERLAKDGMIKRSRLYKCTAIIEIVNYTKYQGGRPRLRPSITPSIEVGLTDCKSNTNKVHTPSITPSIGEDLKPADTYRYNSDPIELYTPVYNITCKEEIKERRHLISNIPGTYETPGTYDKPLPPEFSKVEELCRRMGYKSDPRRFFEHYRATGWTVNGSPVQDWTKLLAGWERRTLRDEAETKRRNTNGNYNDTTDNGRGSGELAESDYPTTAF